MNVKQTAIRKAIIVDDGVDPSPLVADLGNVDDDWSVFWADLNDADKKLLEEIYPEYIDFDAEELSKDQAFVALMFKNRKQFSGAALSKVFETFVANQEQVRKFIDAATARLKDADFEVTEIGRDFIEAAIEADLIIVDLFLGSEQTESDKGRSIAGLKEVLATRADKPPMVILTSAHNGLRDLRHEFRDETGLLASGFRTIQKSDIHDTGRLEQLIFELAEHRNDALKLWTFLKSWETGITKALQRAQSEVRKLDLEDLSHVKKMLSSEGVPLGSYMVDIMDAVLAHELEAEDEVIEAATALNSLDAPSFPPNSITGNKNTLEVVRKTLFVHEKRRRLDPCGGFPVSLGDIIAISSHEDGQDARNGTIFEGEERRVFLVLTPLCDLVRDPPKARRVLLLAGIFHELGAHNYKAIAVGEHTPVLDLGTELRGIVKWDLKHVETIDKDTLLDRLGPQGPWFVPGRLRDQAAIALQQKLLSDLGRVGELKLIPPMIPVRCTVYFTDNTGILSPLPTLLDGILVVDKQGRLAFDADHRFDFMRDVRTALEKVYDKSKEKLEAVLQPAALDALFTSGIKYSSDTKPKPCNLPKGEQDIEVGKITFNTDISESFPERSAHQSVGLIFNLDENI